MGGGGSTTTTESEQETRLSEELRDSSVLGLEGAENLYNAGTEGIYQGTQLADEDPLISEAQQGLLDLYSPTGGLTDLVNTQQTQLQNMLMSGDLENNSIFQQQMEDILGEASTQFKRQAVPIFQQGTAIGQYGGSEGMEGLGLLGGEIDRNTQRALVQSALGQQQLGLQAQGMLPNVLRTGMMGQDVAENIGKYRSLRGQAELQDEIQMSEAERNANLRNLSEFYQFLQGSPLVAEADQYSKVTQETASDPFSALLGTAMTVMGMPTGADSSIGGDIFGSLFGGE